MYARNGANGGEEAEGFKQENGYLVGTPGWSCTTLCGVEHSTSDADGTFFPPSADQNQSTKHKNVLGSNFCSDIFSGSENNTRIGLWIPRFVTSGMGNLDLQADRVTSNVIQLMDSSTAAQNEKKKVAAARKSKRCSKGSGSGNSSNKDLMEVYRISRPSGSKDRHSKVATAKGPRDRRMRLSVETAVKFFHVQDRLGFDQPSKAVEWLIDKCSSAIDELPHISHSESLPDFKSLSTPCMNSSAAELIMNCERDQRKRSRSSKLISTCSPNVKELKTKAKERDQEGSKRRRKGQAKLSSVQVNQRPVETMSFRQGLLHMHSHDLSGIRSFESRHKTPYFNCAQYSPEIAFQSYPSSSVQSAESFSGRDSTTTTTTFSVPSSCPFPRVMPSISIDPQSNISEF